MKMTLLLIPLIATLLFGCGGGGGGGGTAAPPPPVITPTPPPLVFPSPPPISPNFVAGLHPVVLPSVAPPASMSPALLGFIESLNTQMARRGSTAGPNDKELVGTFISAGGPYLGIAGIFSAYSPAQLSLPTPSSGITQLFAPLVIPPDHGCLVPASYYYNFGAGPQAAFIVSDFCAFDVRGPLTALFTPMNASFLSSYVRNNANGVPSYEAVSFTPTPPNDLSTWYVVLFNFTTNQWDLVTSSGGNRPRAEGGAFFGSNFLPGPCPALPTISTLNLALANNSGGYELVAPTMSATTSRILGPPGFADVVDSCFIADPTGPPSYNFNVIMPNSIWTVSPR